MTSKNRLRGMLSLSAASMALLQGSISAKGETTTETTSEPSGASNGQITSKTDKLIIEPPHQKELLRLYADHSSHASHSSHVSGAGGGSYDSTPVTPYYPPAAYTQPPPPVTYPVNPQPAPPSVVPINENSSAGTNILSATNELVTTNGGNNEASSTNNYIEFLKKDAAKGSSSSQYTLAIYYIHGDDGCETNVEKAKMLLELSSLQGNDVAKKRLEQLAAGQKSDKEK
jgi:TPR repeat protein